MSAARRAWIVAASIGAVEALKDQGICRWNGVLRSMQQHVKNNIIIRSSSYFSQDKNLSNSSTSVSSAAVSSHNNIHLSKEERMRKVMELSCWGPNTTRF